MHGMEHKVYSNISLNYSTTTTTNTTTTTTRLDCSKLLLTSKNKLQAASAKSNICLLMLCLTTLSIPQIIYLLI